MSTDELIDSKYRVIDWPQKGGAKWLVEVTGPDDSVTPICPLALAKLAPDLVDALKRVDQQAIRAGRENRGWHVVPSDTIALLRTQVARAQRATP